MDTRPEWMSDPLVNNIPEKKLKFLEEMFTQGHGKTQKEMMTFLMPMMKKAKKENLTFTPQEMNAAIVLTNFITKLEDLMGEQTEFREELWGGLVDHIRIDEKSSTVVFRGGIEIAI